MRERVRGATADRQGSARTALPLDRITIFLYKTNGSKELPVMHAIGGMNQQPCDIKQYGVIISHLFCSSQRAVTLQSANLHVINCLMLFASESFSYHIQDS